MPPCENCHAGCCRSFAIPVTGADLLRIERDLSLSFWEIACRWADAEGQIAGRYVPHFFFADEPETPFAICLKQTESSVFPQTRRCQFLQETPPDTQHPLGQGRCGIYASRPMACRVFPTRFSNTGPLVVLNHVPQRVLPTEDGPIYNLCGRPWEAADIDPIQGLQDLVIAKFEAEFYQQVAAAWNQHRWEWDIFPAFLQATYEQRVVQRTSEGLASQVPPILSIHSLPKKQRRAA